MKKSWMGVCAVIASALVFGLLPLFSTIIFNSGGNAASAALYRFLLALPLLWAYLKRKGISLSITLAEWKKVVMITLFGYGGTAVLLLVS